MDNLTMDNSELDLNLENYDLDDILSLFHVSYNYDSNDLKKGKEILLQLHPYKCKIDSKYFDFYSSAYKIVECLHVYRENKLLSNVEYYPNHGEDNDFINKIKEVHNFQKYEDVNVLIDKINNKNNATDIVYKKMKENRDKLENLSEQKKVLFENSNTEKYENSVNYENTFPNDIVSGSINSIKRITQFKNLHLNSCFREKYYITSPTSFHLHIPSEVKNVVSMKLASIEIPNSWYLFSNKKKNNQFKIIIMKYNEDEETIPEFKETIIIPEGNYDNEALENYLNSTYFYETSEDTPLQHIKFSINNHSLKTSFELVDDAPEKMEFAIEFSNNDGNDNIMNTAGWIMGFRSANYINIIDNIESEGLYDGGGDRYVYFCIDDFQYNRNESNIICFDESTLDKSVLAKIPMVNGKLSLVVEQNLSESLIKTRRYNGPINLKKLSIKLIDRFGENIDLNFMDFSFTLELEILYERNGVV
jgi:hypothetical protein